MNEYQKNKIRDTFYQLFSTTSCDSEFLLIFKESQVLNLCDIQTIEDTVDGPTFSTDKAYKFYMRILASDDAQSFEVLLNALEETKQIVPLEILRENSRTRPNQRNIIPSNHFNLSEGQCFKRTRGRYSDLPTKFLKEAAFPLNRRGLGGSA